MKCICSFLLPTEGKVNINGKRLGKNLDFRPISALLSKRV
jgi:ABC-type multidrug transport system ATPase subunit